MNHFKYQDSSNNDVTTTWEPNPTRASSLTSDEEAKKMREMMLDLTQAVLDPGTNKSYHMKTLVRHRTEWPYLWAKIDEIVSFIESDTKE